MKPASAQSVAHWLDGEATFRELAARVDRLVVLQARLAEACPRIPLTVVAIDGETLTLQTRTAAWAARLRQMTPTLLDVARRGGAQVSRIRIVPQRAGLAEPPARTPRAAVPRQALRELEQLRQAIGTPALEQAIGRLVRRQRGGRNDRD